VPAGVLTPGENGGSDGIDECDDRHHRGHPKHAAVALTLAPHDLDQRPRRLHLVPWWFNWFFRR